MSKIKLILDLCPSRSCDKVRELPKGKPNKRVVYSRGAFKRTTYFFGRDVYIKVKHLKQSAIFFLRPEVVTDKGDFIK